MMDNYEIIDVSNCSYVVNFEDHYFGFTVPIDTEIDFIQSKKKLDKKIVLKDDETYFYLRGVYIKYRLDKEEPHSVKDDRITVHGSFNVYKKFDSKEEFTKEII